MHSTIIRDYALLLVLLIVLVTVLGQGLRQLISHSLETAIHPSTTKVKVRL